MNVTTLDYLSLFAGVGGFDLGFERAGMRCVAQCEQHPYRRAVLAKHWPNVPRFEDVRTLTGEQVGPVDIICGGFPCQDLSYAGKGVGIDGARSGLWGEMFRLVCELRPRYLVVENVSALLRRGMGRVLGDLASIGYDAEWDCLRAADFGAPHLRDRVWIVAYPGCVGSELRREAGHVPGSPGGTQEEGLQRQRGGYPAGGRGADGANANRRRLKGNAQQDSATQRPQQQPQRWYDANGLRDDVPDAGGGGRRARVGDLHARQSNSAGKGAQLADTESVGPSDWDGGTLRTGQASQQPERCEWWKTEPDVGRVADGIPSRVDRLSALGDALVPQIAEWIGRRLMASEAA